MVCKCGSLHIIRVNKNIYKCIKCERLYNMIKKEVCYYCGESVHILEGPHTYKYDKRIRQVVHMRCYVDSGGT